MRPQESTDYSGMTRQEAMQSMYGVTQKPTPVGFREGVSDIYKMASMPFVMFGVPGMLGHTAKAVLGSRAYKYYGYAKYPVLSVGKHYGVRGASTMLSLAKGYSKLMTVAGLVGFRKNMKLAQQREYKRLGINVFGPPFSLYVYDKYMADTSTSKQEETAMVEAIKTQSRRDGSLPSKSKTRGKPLPNVSGQRYHLGRTRNWAKGHNPCASGYKLQRISGIYYCVKQ